MRYADCHIHSIFSHDATSLATLENIAKGAYENGAFFIAITDHNDMEALYNSYYPRYPEETAPDAVHEFIDSYKGPLKISYGIELGQPHAFPVEANSFLSAHPVDTLVCSLHISRDGTDFYSADHKNFTQEQIESVLDLYFDETLEVTSFEGIDIFAHLSYPLRYIFTKGRYVDIEKFFPKIEKLYKHMVKRNVCLECNTNSWSRSYLRESMIPVEEKLFSLYYEVGGRLVSFGSDAHDPSKICASFDEAAEMLKRIGFKSAAFVYKGEIETYNI